LRQEDEEMICKITLSFSGLAVLVGVATLCACAKAPPQPTVEQPISPQDIAAPSPTPELINMPQLPPPTLEEVQRAVIRIFKTAVTIDSTYRPSFLVGDFNGDHSQDLAVIVKPADGRLSELNQEFPNWIAREPLKEVLASKSVVMARANAAASSNPAAGQTVRFEQRDVLLAIIHGFGPRGWHDPEATQTHLLRDVVGSNMRTLPLKEAISMYKGTKPFPAIHGDLIQDTLIGQSGFLHFAGSIYAWYDPKNYQPEVGPMHGH
jgi:hypothetical protein